MEPAEQSARDVKTSYLCVMTDCEDKTATARSTYNPVPFRSMAAGQSGHMARTRCNQPSNFSRNFLGRA